MLFLTFNLSYQARYNVLSKVMSIIISQERKAKLFDSVVSFLPVALCLFGVFLCVTSFFLASEEDELIISAIGLSSAVLGMSISVCHMVIEVTNKKTKVG